MQRIFLDTKHHIDRFLDEGSMARYIHKITNMMVKSGTDIDFDTVWQSALCHVTDVVYDNKIALDALLDIFYIDKTTVYQAVKKISAIQLIRYADVIIPRMMNKNNVCKREEGGEEEEELGIVRIYIVCKRNDIDMSIVYSHPESFDDLSRFILLITKETNTPSQEWGLRQNIVKYCNSIEYKYARIFSAVLGSDKNAPYLFMRFIEMYMIDKHPHEHIQECFHIAYYSACIMNGYQYAKELMHHVMKRQDFSAPCDKIALLHTVKDWTYNMLANDMSAIANINNIHSGIQQNSNSMIDQEKGVDGVDGVPRVQGGLEQLLVQLHDNDLLQSFKYLDEHFEELRII